MVECLLKMKYRSFDLEEVECIDLQQIEWTSFAFRRLCKDCSTNSLLVILIFSKYKNKFTYGDFSSFCSEGFYISIDGAPCKCWEIKDGFLATLPGTSSSISESFFFNAALALTLFVVESYFATSFLLSFFFYSFIISAG